MSGGMPDFGFVADHMLIKVGKYLCMAGADAVWDLQVRTQDLIHRPNREIRSTRRKLGIAP